MEKIDDLLKTQQQQQQQQEVEGEEVEGEEENIMEEETTAEDEVVDPMAMQMLRSNLSHRIESIQRGNRLTETSSILIKSLSDLDDNHIELVTWMRLAAGTILHSDIGVADVVDIVALYDVKEVESCISPYTALCSPTDMKTADGKHLVFPTLETLHHISDRCQHRQANNNNNNNNNSNNQCANNDSSNENDNGIPSTIPDGYLDYYTVVPRKEDDPYAKILLQMQMEDEIISTIHELMESYDEANEILLELNKELEELQESIGGNDETYYGVDGEIHALKDECLEMEAGGKYSYELCLFGSASQRDIGATSGGTNLGKWDGVKNNDDNNNGERIFMWTGGAKCWNGPVRSATAYVTCGTETKLLSAEEPNVCQYEFQIESYIACDEAFKNTKGL